MVRVSAIIGKIGLGMLASGTLLVINAAANRFIQNNADSLAGDVVEKLEQVRDRRDERREQKRYVA